MGARQSSCDDDEICRASEMFEEGSIAELLLEEELRFYMRLFLIVDVKLARELIILSGGFERSSLVWS